MIKHLKNSFDKAEKGLSKLDDYILTMEGMSGIKTRHFYNNVVDFPDSRYLEVGVYKGSSFCSAIFGNNIKATAIDNWSQFGDAKEEFHKNLEKCRGNNYDITVIEHDCFDVVPAYHKFNVYMYDGGHSQEDHYKSLTHFYPCLEDQFIFIVDDWNWSQVRFGVLKAIVDLKLDIIWQNSIFTSQNDETKEDKEGYWNGITCILLKKS